MSCSCSCCCMTPSKELLHGIWKKELLVGKEEEEEEESRRNMDISVLREQYRNSRETQRTHIQVLLFRKVSVELSDAVNVVPVAQGLTSPPATTFESNLMTYDPWHVHLDLHRRSCPTVGVQLPSFSPGTTNSGSEECSWSSSSEDGAVKQCEDSLSVPLSSSQETSSCSSFSGTKEEDYVFSSAGESDPGSSDRYSASSPTVDVIQVASPDGSFRTSGMSSVCSSFSDSQETYDESSTPVASITSSPSTSTKNSHQDLEESKKKIDILQSSRKSSAPALRFTRQLSLGGVGPYSSSHYPFPSRRNPRISEAAKRLGMYSSF